MYLVVYRLFAVIFPPRFYVERVCRLVPARTAGMRGFNSGRSTSSQLFGFAAVYFYQSFYLAHFPCSSDFLPSICTDEVFSDVMDVLPG